MSETAENKRFVYQFGKFTLDPQEKTLFVAGEPLRLPAKEFETLLLLVENNGKALSKEQMMRAIWHDAFIEESNLAKQISRLRKIFNREDEIVIETLPKHGYRFSAKVDQIAPARAATALEKRTVKPLTGKLADEAVAAPPARPRAARKISVFAVFAIAALLLSMSAAIWYRSRAHLPPKIDSIAILPLRALTGEENNKALGLGLTDALITKIGSLRTVAVRPLSAVARFNDAEADAIEIGKKLNVAAVLEGTIQQADNRVRVNVRLLNVADGEQLWAEKFDAASTKIFDLEDRLSEHAARALGVRLGAGENEHLTKRFTTSPEAFDDYLKGRYFWNKRTGEGFRRAIDFFNGAVAKDPNYALALAGLADCYILLGVWGAEPPQEVFPAARTFAERALQSDPDLTEALVSRAFVEWVYDWEFERADADFSRAIELNPNYATAHHWYSYFLVSQKRFDEAFVEIEKARELEGPLNISVNTDVGEIYSWAGKYDEAETSLRDVLKIEPDYAVAHYVLAINLLKQNRVREAIAEAETARRLESEPRVLSVLAFAYAAGGEREKALKVFDELNNLPQQKYVSPFSKAVVLIGLGETEAAIDELEKAYRERSDTMAILGVHPLLQNLKANPRFVDLQRRVGLATP